MLAWTARWSLTSRILAVNVFALAMLAGSFFYLDTYRTRLAEQRLEQAGDEAQLIAETLSAASRDARPALATRLGASTGLRLRIYGPRGNRLIDSWDRGAPTYRLRDPTSEPWQKHIARFLDRAFDTVVGAPTLEPFAEPRRDTLAAWDEARAVRAGSPLESRLRRAPDQTPVLTTALPLPDRSGDLLLVTGSARDITKEVRAERFAIGMVIATVMLVSILLSLFLARTIVRPLRRLARAAVRVRLGRAREVIVPRLPSRRDEIGMLARALSDMSLALRQRIDAVETFAADVSHELKNPLASLRSAVEALERVEDPALRRQLLDLIRDDVVRLDRLITDVAEVSRLDAELSRARFERVDLGALIEPMLTAREVRGMNRDARVAFARPYADTAVVFGDPSRLARMIENLIDNGVSFSPPGGLVEIGAVRVDDEVRIQIDDEGPGVPPDQREAIFRRFHSIRPEGEEFGRHSGLGLAIARAVVAGHDGTIEALDRGPGEPGARFLIRLPAASI